MSTVQARASSCKDNCKLPNCLYPSTSPPKDLDPKKIPQLVLLTFDDAVQLSNYNFYNQSMAGKHNPDGCPISATYFVSHEYTDYTVVNKLYSEGHEIALHSITHNPQIEYWRDADVQLLKDEFGGMRDIIVNFAAIPKEHIYGIRAPFLQMSGDNSTQAIKELGLEYDCSWPTQAYVHPGLWPYTLDCPSTQDCPIAPCPSDAASGVWIQPMINMKDNSGVPCAMADACADIPKDVQGLLKFMKDNFHMQYDKNRAPFGFYVHAAWFVAQNNHFEAYKLFIDYLLSLKDVYIVNIHRALQWVRNPSTLDNLRASWPACNKPAATSCTPTNCPLKKGEEERWMNQCDRTCPDKYPWLGNPLGE